MPQPNIIEHHNPELDLTNAFNREPGYHGAAWVEVTDTGYATDRPVPNELGQFLTEVARLTANTESIRELGRIGCAYMRVIDGANPENYMKWHVDNEDGGLRFHTAISTDGAKVNLAWPQDESLVGQPVENTDWQQAAHQPDNGVIVGFTTQPHGVLPQPSRPGEKTAIFFATLYKERSAADLYSTNNTSTESHAMLPSLEDSRYPLPYQQGLNG